MSLFHHMDRMDGTNELSKGNASGADCLTPKGFTFMRAQVSEGVWVDLYNLHADAG